MKIQCSCGTKYAFDITPEMARAPITFVCKQCGTDSSQMINQLIRQELGLAAPLIPSANPPAPAVAPPPTREAVIAHVHAFAADPTTSAPSSQQAAAWSGLAPLRVTIQAGPATGGAAPETVVAQRCLKHLGEPAAEQCRVCQKPICPKCMELFGYVCSPLCKAKAEAQGIELPGYENRKSAVEAREWRKVSIIAGAVAAVVIAVLGVWFWYAWFASVPKVAFSVRFPEAGYSGQCRLLPRNQVVFLHGGTLARHDAKSKKEIWSLPLIDKKQIEEQAATMIEHMNSAREQARLQGADLDGWTTPTIQELTRRMEGQACDMLHLHAQGESVWVSFPDKLVRYDWLTGKSSQEIPLPGRFREPIPNGDELLLIAHNETGQQVTHVNLVSGESRVEEIAAIPPPPTTVLADAKSSPNAGKAASAGASRVATNRFASRSSRAAAGKAGSNGVAAATQFNKAQLAALRAASQTGQLDNKPLNPAAVANKAQSMPLPAKLALPATVAANANQQRLLAEMRDEPEIDLQAEGSEADDLDRTSLLPDGQKFVQFSVKLVESKLIQVQAMKAPPKKSALEGDVNASSTDAVANEILNEIQRDRGGDVVTEDASRYQVTLRRPGSKDLADWVGEVTGVPELFPLKTVDVLAAGKSIWVIDKSNKKLWESKLNFPMNVSSRSFLDGEAPPVGEGPAVERGDTLYLFDAGVLGAFDLATGTARWRLPAVGISGLHFDEKGMIYINASTGSPDALRYPNQIDISAKTRQLILKVNAKTGVTSWIAEQEGLVSYISGKFVYTTASHHADESVGGGIFGVKTGLEIPSHIRIKRLDPDNGRVVWEHYQERAPLDLQFEKNTIQLLFRKELQVLTFVSL